MRREYIIETNEGKIYPLGVTKTQGGFDIAFVSQKTPALLLFEKGKQKTGSQTGIPGKCPYGRCTLYDGKGRFYRSGICL